MFTKYVSRFNTPMGLCDGLESSYDQNVRERAGEVTRSVPSFSSFSVAVAQLEVYYLTRGKDA